MDKKVKYVIIIAILFANVLLQLHFGNDLLGTFISSLFLLFLCLVFGDIRFPKFFLCLSYFLTVVCLVNIYFGFVNNDSFKLFTSIGTLLILLWSYYEFTLHKLTQFFLGRNYYKLSLMLANCYLFFSKNKAVMLAIKGNILNLLDRFDEALICLNESEESGYSDHYLYKALSYCWINLKDYDKAHHYFKLTYEAKPDDIENLLDIAHVLIYFKDYDEASYYLDKAAEIDEHHWKLKKLRSIIEESDN